MDTEFDEETLAKAVEVLKQSTSIDYIVRYLQFLESEINRLQRIIDGYEN